MITAIIIILIIGIIGSVILNVSDLSNDDKTMRTGTMIVVMILGFFLGVMAYAEATPTIEDYIHGKVKLEIKQTVEDGIVVKCDTLYYYK